MSVERIVVPVRIEDGRVCIGTRDDGRFEREVAPPAKALSRVVAAPDGGQLVVSLFAVGEGAAEPLAAWGWARFSPFAEPALADDDERAVWDAARRALPLLLAQKPVCAVVGCRATSDRFTPQVQKQAYEIGATAARAGYVLLTGGLSGVMQRAARGAAEAGGETMGILPGTVKAEANPYVRVVVPSGIGIARNYLMALTADVMVAVNGGRGTLEEICYALDFERRVLTWDSWPMDGAEKITSLEQCEAALVEHLEAALLAQLGDSNNA
ncbi:MAG: LOG family protein [Myxococcales bacterium]|nr:LOG family protein [Myxococcales bacterium]